MIKTTVMAITLAAGVAMAQVPPEDHIKANAPLATFADSLGDPPNAPVCAHRATMMMRVGRARLAGKNADEAKRGLPPQDRDVNTDEIVGIMYAGPPPQSMDDVTYRQFDESSKCWAKHGMAQAPFVPPKGVK